MKRNPHPHVKVRGTEVIAWPDGVVGLRLPNGYSHLYSPSDAESLARALLKMAEAAQPSASRDATKEPNAE